MSLMAMNRGVKKFGMPVIVGLGALMAFTSFYRSGGGMTSAGQQSNAQSNQTPIATAGTRPIFKEQVERLIDPQIRQYEMMGSIVPATDKDSLRLMALESFRQEAALRQAAAARGYKITPEVLSKEREVQWQEGRVQLAENLGLTKTATDAQMDEAFRSKGTGLTVAQIKSNALTDDALTTSVYRKMFEDDIKKGINVDVSGVRRGYNEVKLRKIVVPFGEGKLTEEAARAKAQSLLDTLKTAPEKMAELATNNSADITKKTGGLSDLSPAQTYEAALVEAAFKTGVGKIHPELVRVVQPDQSAFHIVKLEEEKVNPKALPPDFEKNQGQYVSSEKTRRVGNALMDVIQAELPKVPLNITEPLLKSAWLIKESVRPGAKRDQFLQDALNLLSKVDPKTDSESVAPLRKAEIHLMLNHPLDAIADYREALKQRNLLETRLKLVNMLATAKQFDDAKKELVEVEKMAVPTSQMAYTVATLYGQVKENTKSREWMTKAGKIAAREAERRSQQLGTQVPGASTQVPSASTQPVPKSAPEAPKPSAPAKP
jgi:PPIC-type PPIASE domain/SurA N-terminal domain